MIRSITEALIIIVLMFCAAWLGFQCANMAASKAATIQAR